MDFSSNQGCDRAVGADMALGSSPGSYITVNLNSKQATNLSSLLTASSSSDCLSLLRTRTILPLSLLYLTLYLLTIIESNCLVPQGTRWAHVVSSWPKAEIPGQACDSLSPAQSSYSAFFFQITKIIEVSIGLSPVL